MLKNKKILICKRCGKNNKYGLIFKEKDLCINCNLLIKIGIKEYKK